MGEKRNKYSTEEIIEGVKTSNRKILNYVYKRNFDSVRIFVEQRHGSRDEAWDVFQEGMIRVYDLFAQETKQQQLKNKQISFHTFFIAICKHVWLNKLRDRGSDNVGIFSDMDQFGPDEHEFLEVSRESLMFRLFHKYLNTLLPDCQKLIKMTIQGHPSTIIMHALGFISEQAVYNKKQKCIKRLFEKIKNDRDYIDYLKQ